VTETIYAAQKDCKVTKSRIND